MINNTGLKRLPDFDPKEVEAMMASIDTDKSGRIEYTGRKLFFIEGI